jgi:hypothetical protein
MAAGGIRIWLRMRTYLISPLAQSAYTVAVETANAFGDLPDGQ